MKDIKHLVVSAIKDGTVIDHIPAKSLKEQNSKLMIWKYLKIRFYGNVYTITMLLTYYIGLRIMEPKYL